MILSLELALLAVLIVLSSFFSCSETAIMSLDRIRVQHLARKNVKGAAALQQIRQNPEQFLATILVGNNLVNIAASAIGTSIAIGFFGSLGVGIATGVMVFVLLVFGEITPKAYASRHAETLAPWFAGTVLLLEKVLYPVVTFFMNITKLIIKENVAYDPKAQITTDYLESFISMSAEYGVIKKDEKEIMKRAIMFDGVFVKDVMIPRINMVFADLNTGKSAFIRFVISTGYSRIPVCEGSIDNIKGIIYVRDLLKYVDRKPPTKAEIVKMIKPAMFVPETKKINELFKEFQGGKIHIAIAVDEHGGVSGLVTMEDLVEELVGDIYDEKDKYKMKIKKVDNNTFIIEGNAEIDEVEKELGIKIADKDAEYGTFSGFVLQKLGRIPSEHEEFEFSRPDIKVIVEAADKIKVQRLRVVKR